MVWHDDKAVEIVSLTIEVPECRRHDFPYRGQFQVALTESPIQPSLDLIRELLAVGDVGFVAPWFGVLVEKSLPFLLPLPEFRER